VSSILFHFILDIHKYPVYGSDMATYTKISFNATKDDMKLLDAIKRTMSATQGKVTNSTALRVAIRAAAK
jgi:hypothetical protein